MHRRAPWLDLALKAALLILLVSAALRPDLAPFAKEDMPWRVIFYPLPVVFLPLVWWVVGRPRKIAYPFVADALLMLPFLIDTVAGMLGLYDALEQWDDVAHFVGGLILATALGHLFFPERLGRAVTASLCIGWSAVAVILWELAQYVTLQKDSPNQAALYPDTLSDMACGLGGALVGAVLTITLLWPVPPSTWSPARWPRSRPAPSGSSRGRSAGSSSATTGTGSAGS
jgi:hypothetical protein